MFMRTATIYNFLLEATLMASIAIVLMFVVRKCFRRQLGNRVICFAWLLVALRLLCPLALPNPAINQIRPYAASDQDIRPIAGQLKVRFADASEEVYRLASRAVGTTTNHPVTKALDTFVDNNHNGRLSYRLMQVYALGAGFVLCWFIVSNLRFRYRLRADRIEPIDGDLLTQYLELCAVRGVKPVPVYFTDPLPSACLAGVFKPYIALPLTAKPQEAIQVLTHEISHLKGHDNLWGVLRLLCCIVHWFNPLVWMAADMSRTDCELACDDRVVKTLKPQEKVAYANVLVLAAAKRNAPGMAVLATGMTMTGKRLKTRVNAILHGGYVKKGLALSFALLACVALLGAFATAEYTAWPDIPTYAEAQPVKPYAIDSKEAALAYGKSIWENPYLQQDTTGAAWTVNAYDDQPARYEVIASSPDFLGDISVTFLLDGRIILLNNGSCGKNRAGAAGALYGVDDPDKEAELLDFICRAADQLVPGLSSDIMEFRSTGDGSYSNSSQHFSSFYAANAQNRYAYSFRVQTVPTVRLVEFWTDTESNMMNPDEQFAQDTESVTFESWSQQNHLETSAPDVTPTAFVTPVPLVGSGSVN